MTIKNIEDQKLQLDLERKDLELRQKELEYLAAVYEDDTISTFEEVFGLCESYHYGATKHECFTE